MTNARTLAQVINAGTFEVGASEKNVIIGGDFSMNPWQRGTSFALTTTPAYTADRFQASRASGTANVTISQLATATVNDTGYQFAMRIQRTAADTNVAAIQVVSSLEIANCRRLAGKPVTLTVRARAGANLSGTCTLTLITGTGTTDASRLSSAYTGDATVLTIDLKAGLSSSVFTDLTATVTLASTVTQLAVFYTHTPTATSAGANDLVDIEMIQLENAPFFTGYGYRDKGRTLRDCLRYAVVYFQGSGAAFAFNGLSYSTTNCYYIINFPVPMRTPPATSPQIWSSLSDFYCSSSTNSTFPAPSSITPGTISVYGIILNCVSTGLIAGGATGLFSNSSTAKLTFSAEL